MKKKLIGISVLVGIIVILFIIFGNQKDILRNVLDEDSVIWLGFTEEELDSLMTENGAVLEDGVYKCSFLGYNTKIAINIEPRTGKESYYDISDMVLSIPYDTQEKKAEIIEKLDRYIRSKVFGLGLGYYGLQGGFFGLTEYYGGTEYSGVYGYGLLKLSIEESTSEGNVELKISDFHVRVDRPDIP